MTLHERLRTYIHTYIQEFPPWAKWAALVDWTSDHCLLRNQGRPVGSLAMAHSRRL
jgi:hypothetical protein